MSDDTNTDGGWKARYRFTGQPAKNAPSFEDVGFLMADPILPKPVVKNKVVEKKIKRRGWSKQFYEK